MNMVDLTVELLGMELRNPFVLVSGVFASNREGIDRCARAGVGAIVTKSISLEPRTAFPGPNVVELEDGLVLNAMGLPNPGIEHFLEEYEPEVHGVPIIPSIFSKSKDDLAELAGQVADAGAPAIELNLSCPHSEGTGTRALISQDPDLTKAFVAGAKERTDIPIVAKLTPNVTDIAEIAGAAIEGGADAISTVNTFAALEIDPVFKRPVLGNGIGGQSGSSIRPLAQRKVADITLAMDSGTIPARPVIGMGGVLDGLDAARFILLGARAIGIGTVLMYREPEAIPELCGELMGYLQEQGVSDLDEIRGGVLAWFRKKD